PSVSSLVHVPCRSGSPQGVFCAASGREIPRASKLLTAKIREYIQDLLLPMALLLKCQITGKERQNFGFHAKGDVIGVVAVVNFEGVGKAVIGENAAQFFVAVRKAVFIADVNRNGV